MSAKAKASEAAAGNISKKKQERRRGDTGGDFEIRKKGFNL